jgi:shikimate dehydrogenase
MQTYGLLGKNISYSLSHAMHNAAFRELNLDAEYKTFDIPENELDAFFARLKKGEISGCNVTMPYKEKSLEYVDACDNLVKSIGALNTIVTKDGILKGHNTDYDGFINALTGTAPGDLGFEPGGKSVFVFGAGGAARTVVFSLLSWAPEFVKRIVITDVDIKKAENLADSLVEKQGGDTVISIAAENSQYGDFISKSDLLVNATPCGMKEGDPALFDYRDIHERLYVFDLIYVKDTPLVKEARRRGAKAVNGRNMLLDQAVEAFEYWIEGAQTAAVIKAMRQALFEKLGDGDK